MMERPIILYIIFISLLLILGITFFWLPQYRELSDLRLKVAEKKEELRNKEQYFSRLDELAERLRAFDQELAKIESALPLSPDIAETFHFIDATASKNGLILGKTNIGRTIPLELGKEGSMMKTQLSFSVFGSYQALKSFLSELQTSSRLIFAEAISLKEPEEREGIFSFDFIVRTYSY
jgi:Tfp pilus assembly protein PilO